MFDRPAIRAGVFAAVVTAVILGVATLSIVMLHRLSLRACTEQLGEDMQYLATAAAAQVDPVGHAKLRDRSQQNSAEYERVVAPLRKILNTAPNVKYMYTFVFDRGLIKFVTDASEPGDHDGDGVEDQAKIGEVYPTPDEAMLRCITTGLSTVTSRAFEDQWGRFYSAYVPVRGADGAISFYLGLDVAADVHEGRLAALDRAAMISVAPAAAVAALSGLAAGGLIYSRSRTRRSLQVAERNARHTADRIAAMNRDLQIAVRSAEAGERTKAAFIANMSHEIRTPMTAILGYVDLMTDPAATPEARADYAETIRRAGNHLLAVINDILDMSKIEAGKMSIELIPMCPSEVVRDVAGMLEGKARAKGLRFKTNLGAAMPAMVTGDPTRIRQILVNLVGNAIKFSAEGEITLAADYRPETSRLVVSVTDTGIGMTPDQVSTLFKPFSQADASTTRRFGGTGLGLTISKRLAEAMGGTIMVTSEEGRGSTFTLDLPATGVDDDARVTDQASGLIGVRVLLAEDNPDNQRLIRFHLEHAGAVVHLVDNGLDAVESGSGAGEFDAILLDMQMPGLDGCGAARMLRSRGIKTPLLAITANESDEDREACMDAGFDDFATKPVDPSRLIAMIRRLVPREGHPVTFA